ncbi:sensor histidine kinase [Crateriforma spongiae]|uniref:hypothetical protein n=1 Tax=Crateriforma spongiae TaxID=2724528 RepID=UPI0014475BE8|nr:hypothetical protein [Crateriforma spongiae]
MRVEKQLPKILSCEFPKTQEFKWYPAVGRRNLSLADELRFSVARLLSAESQLNNYIRSREAFCRDLLIGNLSTARETLKRCENALGVSSWWLESRLLLADTEGGFEKTREELSAILELNVPQNALLLAEYASQRVDATMSVIEYVREVHAMVDAGNYDRIDASLPAYLCFMLHAPGIAFKPPTLDEFAFILRSECTRPIVDHYNSVKRLLWTLMDMDASHACEPSISDSLRAICRLNDPDLAYLQSLLASRTHHERQHDNSLAQKHILSGSREAIIRCSDAVRNSTCDFSNYHFLAAACASSNSEMPPLFPENSVAHNLLKAALGFLSYGEDLVPNYWSLAKASMAFSSTPIGHQVAAFSQRGIPVSVIDIRRQQLIHYPTVTAGLFPSRKITQIINEEELRCYAKACIGVTSAGQVSSEKPQAGPCTQALEFLAEAYDCRVDGQIQEAADLFTELATANKSGFFGGEALRGAVECLLELSSPHQAIELISHSQIPPFVLNQLVPIELLVSHYSKGDHLCNVGCIAWPNLFFMDYLFGRTAARQLHSVYANFLEAHGCSRANQLAREQATNFPLTHLEFFLDAVCSIETMQSDLSFRSSSEVEDERMLILQQLQNLAPENASQYVAEISNLQQQIAIRRAINFVSESKIYFNVEGIEKSLSKSFYEQFQRYLKYKNLAAEKRRMPASQWAPTEEGITETRDGAFVLFKTLFQEVRHAVLFSNEHGLDSYLSVRIRHQTIKGAIRSVFDQLHLVADMERGEYQPNEHWMRHSLGLSEQVREKVGSAIIQFSREIDASIDKASGDWMRIREDNAQTEGWFDVSFSELELDQLRRKLEAIEDEAEFLEAVVFILRERLNDCLVTVRHNVSSVLGSRLNSAIDTLEASLEGVPEQIPPELNAAVTRSRTAVQTQLDEIASWFQLQDVLRLEDFSFDTLLHAAIENVKKCFPSSRFECSVKGVASIEVSGRLFPPLWDLLFLVFENVVRHADEYSNDTSVQVEVTADLLRLSFRNSLGTMQDQSETQSRVAAAQVHEPSMIRKEGGSGFAKIRNILKSDLQLDESCFTAQVADGCFEATVALPIDQISP